MSNFHPDFIDKYKFTKEYRFNFRIHGILFHFTVFEKSESYFKPSHLQLFLKKFLQLHQEMYPNKNIIKKQVNIVIYDILLKKRLPAKKMAITTEHINSGYCYINSDSKNTNIVVYRREEAYKVLIHELLHFFNTFPYDHDIQKGFSKHFSSVSNTIDVNEALVELNALCLNCRIIANLTNKPYMKLLNEEFVFSTKQVRKLLAQQNVKFENIIQNKFVWNEKTPAFSYFVLKHIFLANMLNKTLYSINTTLNIKHNTNQNSFIKMTKNTYDYNIHTIAQNDLRTGKKELHL